MRRFLVRAYDDAGHQLMSTITVEVPEAIPLDFPNERMNDGRQADFNAVAYVTGRVAEEFARYGASECLLAREYPKQEKP